MNTNESITAFAERYEKIRREIAKEMIGQEDVVEHLLLAVIAGGNVLLEGVPGLGKTHLVRVLSKVLDLPFSRIQFTPDLMPADITGTNILVRTEEGNAFRFQAGPLFPPWCWPMKSTAPRQRRRRRCWKPCRSIV